MNSTLWEIDPHPKMLQNHSWGAKCDRVSFCNKRKTMRYWQKQIPLLLLTFFTVVGTAQEYFIEGGFGIGNVAGGNHRLGKSELHISFHKRFKYGILGIDFASGGNFIPLESGSVVDDPDIISPKDSRFGTILFTYRVPIQRQFFIEPRLGYASLRAYVHTDDRRQLKQPNFSSGIGLGTSFENLTMTLRYQYFGKTAEYAGIRGQTEVISLGEPVSMILFRVGFRIVGWGKREK